MRKKSMAYIRFDDGTQFDLSISINHLSQPERFRKAFKTFGIVFAIALVSILVPVFHFVLVPLFLIASFILALRQYNKVYEFKLKGVHCPQCKDDLKEGLLTTKESRLSVYCFTCRRNLSIGT